MSVPSDIPLEAIQQAAESLGDHPQQRENTLKPLLRALGHSSGALFVLGGGQELVPLSWAGLAEPDPIPLTSTMVKSLKSRRGVGEGRSPRRIKDRLVSLGLNVWSTATAGQDVACILAVNSNGDADSASLRVAASSFALAMVSAGFRETVRALDFELNRKTLELATLHDAGLALSATLQAHEVIEEVLELAVGVVDGRAGFMFIKHARSGRLELAHQIGLDDRIDILARPALRRHLRNVVSDRHTAELMGRSLPEGVGESSLLICPVGEVGCLGVIDKESRSATQPFGEADARLLELIAQQAGAAIANARLYREVVEVKNQNENILSSVGNGVISTDLRGRVTHYNPAVSRVFGESAPEEGKSCASFFARIGCTKIAAAVRASLEDGESRQIEGEVVEGGVTLDSRITPLADEAANTLGVVVTIEDLTEEMRVRSMFRQYASDQVVDLLLSDRSTPALGGEERDVTVLFVDIRQSTTLLSRIGPEGMVSLLNDCFARMNEIIFQHNGTLDKYTGDGFMVVYGAPVSFPDDTERAVRTAVEMQRELERFNRGKVEPLPLAFGLSRGRVVAGNVGSLRRMEYTCIGPGVVRASRLCDAADGGEILIDQSVYDVIEKDYEIESLGWKRFKGVDPIHVYRVGRTGKQTRKAPAGPARKKVSGEKYVDLAIPMLPEMELTATKTAEAIASSAGFSEEKTEEIKQALIEACINAFEHSDSEERIVRVSFEVDDVELTIRVADTGSGFDVDEARAEVVRKREAGVTTRGWGLKIMEELVDDFEVVSGAKGTVIKLVKRR